MVYGFTVPTNATISSMTLETLSLEVVIGMYAISVLPKKALADTA
jgi:hypothetical protein